LTTIGVSIAKPMGMPRKSSFVIFARNPYLNQQFQKMESLGWFVVFELATVV